MHNTLLLKRTLLCSALSVGLVASALAQAPEKEKEKPRLKDFGLQPQTAQVGSREEGRGREEIKEEERHG